jgi:hypothetical protein
MMESPSSSPGVATTPQRQLLPEAPLATRAQTPRPYSQSNATRLLSAGAYLERSFRKEVIRELVTHWFRVVAPSYGYDTVTVLAHALAARSLRRKQIAAVITGLFIDFLLNMTGIVSDFIGFLLALWLLWAVAFLRRAATLQVLITRLRPTKDGAAEESDGGYPANQALTSQLTEKITREQAGTGNVIFFGNYRPFVGAGAALPDWTVAELLIPVKPNPLEEYLNRDEEEPAEPTAPEQIIPFTVDDITTYVGSRLRAELQEEAPCGEQIRNLSVDRLRYSRAGTVPVKRRWLGRWMVLQPLPSDAEMLQLAMNREHYGGVREYLSVRIGSWGGEIVTSIFVGFDLRGSTLYSEFYPYVLPPVRRSFHLVDRLPERLTAELLFRVAWDVPMSIPFAAMRIIRKMPHRIRSWFGERDSIELVPVDDRSEFRLGRYTVNRVDRGARASVRELAAAPVVLTIRDGETTVTPVFHGFFQEADTLKYTKIIERRVLQIIRDFLENHNVDLGDHDARQATILDASVHKYGDVNNYGGTLNQGGRHVHNNTPSGKGSR